MITDSYEMEVLVNGKPLKEYFHKGNYYVEGKEGSEFTLRLRNKSPKRALFVPTIDGLSVMDGKKASFGSSGYIVGPYSAETIEGWRTSDSEVAKFFFAKISESYAEQKGEGDNVGVIGCAIFKEKEQPAVTIIYNTIEKHVPYPVGPWYPRWPWQDQQVIYLSTQGSQFNCSVGASTGSPTFTSANIGSLSSSGQANSAMCKADAAASIGTGFGEAKYAPVHTVEFERATTSPHGVLTIYYNTREKLAEMGVEFKSSVAIAPAAFPKEVSGYCEPPKFMHEVVRGSHHVSCKKCGRGASDGEELCHRDCPVK